MACRASISVMDVAFFDVKASTAWIRASIPVAAVTWAGNPTVSSGSSSAADGNKYWLTIPFLSFSVWSDKIAIGVTSLPVPAVVGIMRVANPALGMRSMPKYSEIGPWFVAMTAETLAMSMGLPPPIPIRRSAFSRRIISTQSATISYRGSASTSPKTAYLISAFSKRSCAFLTSPASIRPWSVTIKTLFAFRLLTSSANWFKAPGPMTILGVVLNNVIRFIFPPKVLVD